MSFDQAAGGGAAPGSWWIAACIALAVSLTCAIVAPGALAHQTSVSRLEATVVDTTVTVTVRASAHDLAAAIGIETDLIAPVPVSAFEAAHDDLVEYVTGRLDVAAGDYACEAGDPALDTEALPETVTIAMSFECPAAPRELFVGYLLFFDVDSAHQALGVVVAGERREEVLLDAGLNEIEMVLDAPPAPWHRRFLRVAGLGAGHILIGLDHVAFLLALLLAARRLMDLVKIVTAFTLAHSITLSLAWLGLVDPPGRLVEVLIALSVAYVATENLLSREPRLRWLVAFGFGLVHGLGLYGALDELALGEAGLVTTLVGFNVGVEVGQLALVLAIYPVLRWAMRRPWYRATSRIASALVLIAAGYWVIDRIAS